MNSSFIDLLFQLLMNFDIYFSGWMKAGNHFPGSYPFLQAK